MRIIEQIREMQAWSDLRRSEGKRIVLVPTMGFLHEGHLRLIREGKRHGNSLVVSLFVNPAQFAPTEDYQGYPRDFERDRKLLQEEQVDILFHPSVEKMYPESFQTSVEVEKLSPLLCGAFRPGHFRGVTTVVAKLFNISRPHVAVFGAKDYQQLQIMRRMVEDLNFDVEIVSHAIAREEDGLAMSSRNIYLNPQERCAALSLSRSLLKGKSLVEQGERKRGPIIQAVKAEIEKEPLAQVEYVSLCHSTTLQEVNEIGDEAVLALAVRIGKARLIDNIVLKP